MKGSDMTLLNTV